jgi:hypothetical protein
MTNSILSKYGGAALLLVTIIATIYGCIGIGSASRERRGKPASSPRTQ